MALAEKTGLPAVHLDGIFWKENWVESSREEFDAAVLAVSKADKWIMDGNYSRTLPMRLELCDSVIFLDLSRYICILGVLRRVFKYYGKCRPDMGKNCPERLDFSFLRYVWNFKRTQRPKIIKCLEKATVPVVTLKNRAEIKAFLHNFEA